MRRVLLGLLLATVAVPAVAQDDPLAPLPTPEATVDQPAAPVETTPEAAPPRETPVVTVPRSVTRPRSTGRTPPPTAFPAQPQLALPPLIVAPPPPRIIPRNWREVFSAIRTGDWTGASIGMATLPADVLTPVARAELYTARGSPRVDVTPILDLLAQAPDLPESDQLARMAVSRGATTVGTAAKYPIVGLGAAPRRQRARPIAGEPAADALRLTLDPLVKANAGEEAELQLTTQGPLLSTEARAEAAQRVAWIYYATGRDADARRIADLWRQGALGEWGAQAAWVSGLAAWRMGDCSAASLAFRDTAQATRDGELRSGAYYWGARAVQACRRPREVAPLLRAAARSPESFYGLVAREALGMTTRIPRDPAFDAASVEALPNVRRAAALLAIGERGLAELMLRYQARIGSPADHRALIAVAGKLDLPGAQYWLATNGPPGARVGAAARYPTPRWTPQNGWRIDPALAFAHVIQESNFRADAVSPAGAVGLMQVRPGTAGDTARARGQAFDPGRLSDPSTNLDFGQAFIELIRGNGATRGQLPKVIAAYNAGPVPVDRWNYINDKGDPLLWMESIPYWETRYYVPAVLRNMWVYEGLAGADQSSLSQIAQHRWPAFPTARSGLLSAK